MSKDMGKTRGKKVRHQDERERDGDVGVAVSAPPPQAPQSAAEESGNAATLASPAVAPRPPARVRRSSAAVKSALLVIADTPAPPRPAEAEAPAPVSKVKLVRTSFSLAKDDHATLGALKDACREQGVGARKSQLLRVAVGLLRELEPARLAQMVAALPPARKAK